MSVTDLHICQDSLKTSSKSESTFCDCPPEYYCAYICGEGYNSLSTLISWQHFPRSTSSRSRCDETSDSIQKTISCSVEKSTSEKKESTKSSSTKYPITKSVSQLKALHYLEIRHIFDLFNFLIGHLVSNEPDDPVQFLVDLLEKCLKYRDSFGEPPLLFTHSHVKSLYNAFDPFERGYLTLGQYREAMRTLGLSNGITPINQEPEVNDDGYVEQSNFLFEAERCLLENLKHMLRIPKIWEENRLIWKKKMAKRKTEFAKTEDSIEIGSFKGENKDEGFFCKCSTTKVLNVVCRCSESSDSAREPEQLFLDDNYFPKQYNKTVC